MRRLGIYVCYEAHGNFGQYVVDGVLQLAESVDMVYLVINGNASRVFLESIAKDNVHILFRENVGYDAEAYRFVFTEQLSHDNCNFDEIIIRNDSFYGPFGGYKEVFDKFSAKECDFYGFTKWYGGSSAFFEGKDIPSHIQSYFIGFKKRVIESDNFWKFWKTMPRVKSFKDAVNFFEVGISAYLVNCGFQFKVWTDFYDDSLIAIPGDVTFLSNADRLILDYELPILKRKAFSMGYYRRILSAIEYIKRKYTYDIDMVMEGIFAYDRKYNTPLPLWKIKEFAETHDRIYIYGHGLIGKDVESVCKTMGIDVTAFVVSKKSDYFDDILYEQLAMNDNDGLIIAMGERNCREVINLVESKIREDNLLIPEYS